MTSIIDNTFEKSELNELLNKTILTPEELKKAKKLRNLLYILTTIEISDIDLHGVFFKCIYDSNGNLIKKEIELYKVVENPSFANELSYEDSIAEDISSMKIGDTKSDLTDDKKGVVTRTLIARGYTFDRVLRMSARYIRNNINDILKQSKDNQDIIVIFKNDMTLLPSYEILYKNPETGKLATCPIAIPEDEQEESVFSFSLKQAGVKEKVENHFIEFINTREKEDVKRMLDLINLDTEKVTGANKEELIKLAIKLRDNGSVSILTRFANEYVLANIKKHRECSIVRLNIGKPNEVEESIFSNLGNALLYGSGVVGSYISYFTYLSKRKAPQGITSVKNEFEIAEVRPIKPITNKKGKAKIIGDSNPLSEKK